MKGNTFNEYFKPFVVLVCICVVVSFLLAFTNAVTAPVIEKNKRIEAEKTRRAVLSGSDTFTELDVSSIDGISTAYKEDNGVGYVVTAENRGYKVVILVTVGLDNDGKVVGIVANVVGETKGVGTKAGEKSYLDCFIGLSGNAEGINTISGATYSSSAVRNGVSAILKNFESIKGASAK